MIKSSLKTIALSLIVLYFIGIVHAWTEPTVTPPAGNVFAPVTVGSSVQYKSGALGIGGILRGYSNAIFDGNVGIGTTSPTAKLEIGGVPKTDGIKFPDGTMQTTAGSRFVTGTYLGSGVDNREIVVGFQPDDVEVGTTDTYEPMHRNKYMPANTSQAVASGGFFTDAIKNFTPNGFTIGIRDTVNLVGRTYWYNAVKGGTPPPVGAVPVINSISISPSPIATGQSTTISWSSANTVSCNASGQWSGGKSASGSQLITPPDVYGGNGLQADYTYTLTCYNSDGSLSDTKSAIVNVKGWRSTTGNGNLGESCDSWLSRTGQAGVNGSAPKTWTRTSPNMYDNVGTCAYISPDPAVFGIPGFPQILSSSYADPAWQPASYWCCDNTGNAVNTWTRR